MTTSIKHLKCLSAVKSMQSVHPLTPAAFPGSHCPMHTALALGTRIQGVSTLVIGTAECGYYSRNIPTASSYLDQSLHWTYLLDSKEIVFGFRKGLIEAIQAMDQAGAKVILLLVTCVPELIGEDVESICYELQPHVQTKLLHVPLGNFKCGGYQPGYWKTLLAMANLTSKLSVKTNIVNILGRRSKEDHSPLPEILSLLQQYEIPLRFIAPDAALEDFVAAGDAQLSISLSPFMNPLGEQLAKTHDIPFISLHDMYSIKDIDEAYMRLEILLGLPIMQKMRRLRKEAKEMEKRTAALAQGVHYISANIGALQPLPLSTYFTEMGLSPIMIHMEEFYPSDMQWRARLTDCDENPILCLMLNEAADQPFLEALQPDIILGDWGGRHLAKPPTAQLLDLYGQAGYERTCELLTRIMGLLPTEKKGGSHDGTL